MRKKYLEVESKDNVLMGIRIVDQRTKNRREKFKEQFEKISILFFEIGDEYILGDALALARSAVKALEDGLLRLKENPFK